jgi:hypothetical protein
VVAAALAQLLLTDRALDKDEDKEEAGEEEQEQEKEEEVVCEVGFVVRGNIGQGKQPDSNNDLVRLHEAMRERTMSRQILAPVPEASAPPVIA